MTMKKSLIVTLCSLLIILDAGAQTLDSVFATATTMTDEEAKKAATFEHEGKKARIVKEKCATQDGLGKTGCDENQIDANGAILGGSLGNTIEQNIGKLYGVIFGAGFLTGGGPKISTAAKGTTLTKDERKELKKNGSVPNDPNDPSKKNKAEQKNDYCIYAALGYELIAGMMQKTGQQEGATSVASDPQLQALASLKQAHKTRKRTALYQALVYDATLACYTARLIATVSKGQMIVDKMYYVKMAATGVLAGLYHVKSSKHAKAEEAVQTVMNSLPKTGDCNPWTGTACFCKEPSSKTLYAPEYEEICVVNAGDATTPKANLGCGVLTNGVMSFDATCACKATNTCFKASTSAYNPSFGLGANFMNDANKGYTVLSDGIFDQGKFNSYSSNSNAMAKKVAAKIVPTTEPAITLNASQNKLAKDLGGLGALGSAMAASDDYTPPGGGLMNSGNASLAALSPAIKKQLAAETVSAYKQTGAGFDANNSNSEPEIVMPSIGGEAQTDNSTEILSFAEQAVSQADVAKTPETPIFDIISHRYRASGWKNLKTDELK